jgi:hypothetical protein
MQTPEILQRYDRIFDALSEAADNGEMCPSVATVGALFDPPLTRTTTHLALGYLRASGRIKTRRVRNNLVVEIPSTGKTTKEPPPPLLPEKKLGNKAHHVKEMTAAGSTIVEIARKLHIGQKSVARIQKELGIAPEGSPEISLPWREKKAQEYGAIYGKLADDIMVLRRRYNPVCKTETLELGHGKFVVGSRIVEPSAIPMMAAKIRAEMRPTYKEPAASIS